MPYVSQQQSIDEANRQRLGIASSGNISGSSSGSAPASSSALSSGAAPPSTSSGTVVGIKDYLRANAGGAQRLGQDVAANVNKEVGEATSALSAGQEAFQSKAGQGANTWNQGALQSTLDTGKADPTFQRILSGTYSGPRSLSDIGARTSIDKEVLEAQQKGALADTQGGRVQLLRDIAGRPQTTGVTRLNAALLGGNEQGINAVRAASARAKPLGEAVSGAESAASARANEIAASNAALRARGVGEVGSYLTSEEQAADRRIDDLRASEVQKQNEIRNYLREIGFDSRVQAGGSGGLVNTSTQEGRARALSAFDGDSGREGVSRRPSAPAPAPALAQRTLVPGFQNAGISESQARALQDMVSANQAAGGAPLDLTKYFSGADLSGLNRSNVMTPEQARRFSALAEIAGRSGYTSSNPLIENQFNYGGAFGSAQSNLSDAQARTAANQRAADLAAAQLAASNAQSNFYNRQLTPVPGGAEYGGGDGGYGGDGSSGSSSGGMSAADNDSGNAPGTTAGTGMSSGMAGAIGAAIGSAIGIGPAAGQAIGSAIGTGVGASANTSAAAAAANSAAAAQADAQADAQAAENAAQGGGSSGIGSGSSADGSAGVGVGEGGIGSSGAGTAAGDAAGNSEGSGGAADGSGSAGDGSGGGGGGGGCVMATALVSSGGWAPTKKADLVRWCEGTLHDNVLGECFRRGYQVIGSKIGVPALRSGSKYISWTFNTATNVIRLKTLNPVQILNAGFWFSVIMVTGAVVSKRYARKCWTSLYKDKK